MDMAVSEVLLCLFFISQVVLAMVNDQKNLVLWRVIGS